jgi:hypothetical protein
VQQPIGARRRSTLILVALILVALGLQTLPQFAGFYRAKVLILFIIISL